MTTFDQRISPDGQTVSRVQVKRQSCITQTAIFAKFSEAKKWAQVTEGVVLEGRDLPVPEVKRHTRSDLIDRYIRAVLAYKKLSTTPTHTHQLHWRKTHLEHSLFADITLAV